MYNFFLTKRFLPFLLTVCLIVCTSAFPAQATSLEGCDGDWCTPPNPPAAGKDPLRDSGALQAQSLSTLAALPPLKAVLIVGPIDGDTGSWTLSEIANMELAAAELVKNGVQVHKFYTPNNDWNQIVSAAQGAHFLLYRGHGVYMPTTPWTVGGFSLKNKFVSSDDIRRDLKIAQNAIVLLYGCFTAGSSSIDPGGSITLQEAQRRVAQYSDPFFDIGAAGYYADWYGSAFKYFIADLFAGKTLEQAYKSFNFSASTFTASTHPDHPSQALWVDRHGSYYDHAFAGQPAKTLSDLFGSRLEVGTSQVFAIAAPTSANQIFSIPVTSSPSTSFTWAVSPAENKPWLDLSPTSGSGGENLVITLKPGGQSLGSYTTTLTVSGNSPSLVVSQQTITVTLIVANIRPVVYIPIASK